MINTLENILASFAECPLPPLEINPTHAYLTEFNGYLNSCSASVHSNIGNGAVGYLAITTQPAVFALACPNVLNTPVIPGAALILSDPHPTSTTIRIQTHAHAKELRIFNEYYNVEKACKKIILHLFPKSTIVPSKTNTPDPQLFPL